MRLAQLARKVKTKPAEIRKFILDEFKVELDNDPNVKVEEEHEQAVLNTYKVAEKAEPKKIKKEKIQTEPVEEVDDHINEEIDTTVDTDLESLKEIAEEAEEAVEVEEVEEVAPILPVEDKESAVSPKKKVVSIEHDDEVETTDQKESTDTSDTENFEEVEVDPDADIIAARVDKLEGLKVVGKIDLSQDKEAEKLMNEEVELPSAEKVESEIDELDGDVDTSDFPELTEEEKDEEKEALFADLDAQMEDETKEKVKAVTKETPAEVKENIEEEEEYSIYKNARGEYHFTLEQKKNRKKSVHEKKTRERIEREKEKKKRYYEEQVAAKVKPKQEKTKAKKEAKKAERKIEGNKQQPKGLWQRFVHWLND
ncbi:MAG: hypothetical protein WDZ35_04740 [Crocinitomicaceae bacterium]